MSVHDFHRSPYPIAITISIGVVATVIHLLRSSSAHRGQQQSPEQQHRSVLLRSCDRQWRRRSGCSVARRSSA